MSLPSDPTIAFVGLGNMGKFMALNLAKYLSEQKKQPLRVWNRTSSKARDLIKQSKEEHNVDLISVDTLKEVAKTCNVIITSLANDAVVKEVYQEFLNTLEKEGTGKRIIFIETSTVYPSVTTDLYKRAEAIKGVSFISSPPFGPPPMAKSAQLVFAVAGAQDARKEVEQYSE
jgi:3-hydroxyisobutyrate dehydrogenase-like beta-hydroxyacid dehydrogenase